MSVMRRMAAVQRERHACEHIPYTAHVSESVVTKGRTLLAAASRIGRELPHADIRAFALIRTLGFLTCVDRLIEPCEGFVYWAGGDARREP